MSFGQLNSGISRLLSYQQALDKFNTTTRIRGRSDASHKPLGRRQAVDAYNFNLDLTDQSINCYHYSHRLVTYHTDNTITIHHTTNSQSAGNFINDLLGIRATQTYNRFTISIQGNTYNVPFEGIKLSVTPTHSKYYPFYSLSVINPPTSCVHHIKRKEAKRVRGMYTDIQDYVAGMAKVIGEVNRELLESTFGIQEHSWTDNTGAVHKWTTAGMPSLHLHVPEHVEQLFAWLTSDDHMERFKGALFLIKTSAGWRTSVSADRVLEELSDYAIARHKDSIFNVVELPIGTIRRDTYTKFFKG